MTQALALPTATRVELATSTITLRPYQGRAIAHCGSLWQQGLRRVLLQLPTGGGKTVIGARFISGAIAKGKRAVFMSHRREIVGQTYWKLHDDGVPRSELGVMMGDGTIMDRDGNLVRAVNPSASCIVASIDTWRARPQKPPAHVVFVDEAHHCTATTWRAVIDHYTERNAFIVGLTATPERADGVGLGDLFEHLYQIETPSNLIAGGWLARPRIKVGRRKIAGLAALRERGGDYELDGLQRVMRARELVADIVGEWLDKAGNRPTVVFAVGVEHSMDIVRRFRDAGITAEHVDGETEKSERDAILRRLRTGVTRVVSNVGVLTEGWDEPCVKCVVLARPTKSLALYLQMCGRGLRPWENVEPLILDHSDTARRFGPPDLDREWSLEGKPRKEKNQKKDEDTDYPVCEKCQEMLAPGQRICPSCGFEKPKTEIVEVAGVLEDLQWKRPAPPKPTTPQDPTQVAFDQAKAAVNRAIAILVTSVTSGYVTDAGPIDRDRATSELNRLIYRRIGHSRTTATLAELQSQLEWLRSSTGIDGSYSALEELVWVLRATKKGEVPAVPRSSPEEVERVQQLALFAGAPLVTPKRSPQRRIPPRKPTEEPTPPPSPAAPKIAPRAQREMDRALDRALAANKAKRPHGDDFGW